MSVFIYDGGLGIVKKSGVGKAVLHQRAMLASVGINTAKNWSEPSGIVHINTVFPDSVFAALRSRTAGKKVVYYGHSTEKDFRDSFRGSNYFAPKFKSWIKFCYNLGDIVLTPTEYSKSLLLEYGVKKPIYSISNGVDTDFFAPSRERGAAFRARLGISADEKVVISVGHFMARKGLPDFVALARSLPSVRFIWFGSTDLRLVPKNIRDAITYAPPNLCFFGYISADELRDAYCGADVFAFMSHEETEGIVVLEALACGTPTVLRDIPVYSGWLENGRNVYKARDVYSFSSAISGLLSGALPPLSENGRKTAESRSIRAVGKKLMGIYADAGLLPAAKSAAFTEAAPE